MPICSRPGSRVAPLWTCRGQDQAIHALPSPLDLDHLLPGDGPWEVEIGFGKGRNLLTRAAAHPERRFLGIELVTRYHRLLCERAHRRGLDNVASIRAEALYVLATEVPSAFADVLHVYFPDPWPKSRHHKRRLFDPETVDIVLGLLRPGGTLYFATDFLDYGCQVRLLLEDMPGVSVQRHDAPWPDGARTNYESKYQAEGRPILRLVAVVSPELRPSLHPMGAAGILAATAQPRLDTRA